MLKLTRQLWMFNLIESFREFVTNHESGECIRDLFGCILVHRMTTQWQNLHLEFALHLTNHQIFV